MVKNKKISCQIPIDEYKVIEKLVDTERYKSVNDFVQIAVRRLLEEYDRSNLSDKDLKSIRKSLGIK